MTANTWLPNLDEKHETDEGWPGRVNLEEGFRRYAKIEGSHIVLDIIDNIAETLLLA